MTEYDDYVSGRVDANYQEWLEKNPEHKPEHLLTEAEKQEGWDFAAEVTIASLVAHCEELQAKLAVAEAEVERLNEFCYECKHLDGWAWCRESGLTEQREQRDHCLFTPSRWERRET